MSNDHPILHPETLAIHLRALAGVMVDMTANHPDSYGGLTEFLDRLAALADAIQLFSAKLAEHYSEGDLQTTVIEE